MAPEFKHWAIKCVVSLGMFSSERSVDIELPGPKTLSLFVDSKQVLVEKNPEAGAKVPGKLKVQVIKVQDNKAILELPRAPMNSGPRVEVPSNLLQAVA